MSFSIGMFVQYFFSPPLSLATRKNYDPDILNGDLANLKTGGVGLLGLEETFLARCEANPCHRCS